MAKYFCRDQLEGNIHISNHGQQLGGFSLSIPALPFSPGPPDTDKFCIFCVHFISWKLPLKVSQNVYKIDMNCFVYKEA